jgi:hypothetical protein
VDEVKQNMAVILLVMEVELGVQEEMASVGQSGGGRGKREVGS